MLDISNKLIEDYEDGNLNINNFFTKKYIIPVKKIFFF